MGQLSRQSPRALAGRLRDLDDAGSRCRRRHFLAMFPQRFNMQRNRLLDVLGHFLYGCTRADRGRKPRDTRQRPRSQSHTSSSLPATVPLGAQGHPLFPWPVRPPFSREQSAFPAWADVGTDGGSRLDGLHSPVLLDHVPHLHRANLRRSRDNRAIFALSVAGRSKATTHARRVELRSPDRSAPASGLVQEAFFRGCRRRGVGRRGSPGPH